MGFGGVLAGNRNLGALTRSLSLSKLSKLVSRRGPGSLTSSHKILGYFPLVTQRALGAFTISCKRVIVNHWVLTGNEEPSQKISLVSV